MDKRTLSMYKVADEPTRWKIRHFVRSIPDPQTREMFRLHFIAGYSYAQTAKQLGGGMTKECVYSRITRFFAHDF